jgi:hypothetical protein
VPEPPRIGTATVINGAVGEPLAYSLTAANSPTSYLVGRIPAGLTLNTSSGYIYGVPLDDGLLQTTFTASNLGGSAQGALTFD